MSFLEKYTNVVDLRSIQREEETRIRHLRERSMRNRFLHIHSLNSDIRGRLQLMKLHNEISELNSLEQKLSIDERQEKHRRLKMHRPVKTAIGV